MLQIGPGQFLFPDGAQFINAGPRGVGFGPTLHEGPPVGNTLASLTARIKYQHLRTDATVNAYKELSASIGGSPSNGVKWREELWGKVPTPGEWGIEVSCLERLRDCARVERAKLKALKAAYDELPEIIRAKEESERAKQINEEAERAKQRREERKRQHLATLNL
jgi:hypothetical protein